MKALVFQPRPETVAMRLAQGRKLERARKETSPPEALYLEGGEVLRPGERPEEVGEMRDSDPWLGHPGLDVVCVGCWPGFCLSGLQLMG